MSKDNYITNKKLTGGMDMSNGVSYQDLIAIKYIFENMDKGLKYITFEGTDDFTLYYSDGHTIKCQCKIKTLTMKYVASLCAGYDDNDERVIIGSGMNDEFRRFHQKFVRYRNARIGAHDQKKLDEDFQEFCMQKKIDAKKLQNIYFDSVDSISAFDLAKYAIIDYGNRKHIYVDENEIILKLGGMIGFDLRPHANSLSYDQIKALVMKNRVKKSVGMFESDPMFSDYVKNKGNCSEPH